MSNGWIRRVEQMAHARGLRLSYTNRISVNQKYIYQICKDKLDSIFPDILFSGKPKECIEFLENYKV